MPYKTIVRECSKLDLNWIFLAQKSSQNEHKESDAPVPQWTGLEVPPVLAQHELPAWAMEPEAGLAEMMGEDRVAMTPFFEAPVGAGHSGNADLAHVRSLMVFDRRWLRREARIDPDQAFVVRVYGHSMEGKLNDGDLVLCEYRQTPIDGIMAVLYDGELFIKHVIVRGDAVRLASHSNVYPDIEVDPNLPFQVMGRAVRKVVRM